MSGVWTARLAPEAYAGSTGTCLDPDITLGAGVLEASVPDTPDAARQLWELLMDTLSSRRSQGHVQTMATHDSTD